MFDRELSLSTNNQRDGGMQAYLQVNGGALPSAAAATANPDSYFLVAGNVLAVAEPNKGVMANDTGVYGVQIMTQPAGGSVTLNPDGTFTYLPSSNAITSVSLTNGGTGYTAPVVSFVDSGGGTGATATATVDGSGAITAITITNGESNYTSATTVNITDSTGSGAIATAAIATGSTTADSFSYCANGTVTGTTCSSGLTAAVTLAACTGSCLGTAPTATADNYTSNIASRLQISPPGVLANDIDPSGLPMTASLVGAASGGTVTLNPDGSFIVTPAAPPVGAATATVTFQYNAVNSQHTASAAPATATVTFKGGSGIAVVVKDAPTGLPISDYRWIIEEDRSFHVDPAQQTNTGGSPVPAMGVNFHTSQMPVIAQGCVGTISCESGQTILDPATGSHVPTVCDVGNGACRTDGSQFAPVDPGQIALDPTKRYYISILPGDGANPTIGGAGGAVQVDPNCDPNTANCSMRQFSIAKDCGTYTGTGAWEPGGASALCGHAMGGTQIATGQTTATVALQQTPLPTAKISVFVFEDDYPLNGENDAGGGVDILAPNEPGLGNFNLVLLDAAGNFGDTTGQITYDEFNQPVSNSLAGTNDPVTGKDACPISAKSTDGLVGVIPVCPKYESDGTTLSPLAGQAVIANLYPGLYEVVANPGADRIARGEQWLQTSTLDGTKPIEAFIRPGEPNYFQEFGPGGYHVMLGFANPKIINDRKTNTAGTGLCDTSGGGLTCNATVKGQITNMHMSRTPDQRVYSSGDYSADSYTQCYVVLGSPDAAPAFAFTKCDADGKFEFDNVPQGNYQITVFDQWNDLLVDGLSTPIVVGNGPNGNANNLSNSTNTKCTGNPPVCTYEIAVTQWRTNMYTRTFIDQNGDGVSQDSEPGLPLVATNIRYRDGSICCFNSTDLAGNAGFNEVFPYLNWLVAETDSTRYKPTGTHIINDTGGPVDTTGPGQGLLTSTESPTAHVPAALRIPGARYCATADCAGTGSFDPASSNPGSSGRVDPPWVLSEGWQGLLGQTGIMEFGMKPFMPGENGGIKGHVIYASTRPFDDPSLLLQLQWEPGMPNVTVNLYQEGTAPDGTTSLKLVDSTQTSSFDDWAQGFRRDASGNLMTDSTGRYIPNMSCPGVETSSMFYFTLKNSTQTLNPTMPLAEDSRFKCFDGWAAMNQIQPAPYDGMYKFPSVTARDPVTGKPTKTNCSVCIPDPAADFDSGAPMLPPGKYVVEVIVPDGYELVKEEDKNILIGDIYIAPVTQQFAGFGNIFILPDQAAMNSAYNPNNPLNPTTNLGSTSFPRHEGDTGSVEAFWPCVGALRIVPDYNSLFPGAQQAAPFAGASRHLCDRKEVTLGDQMSALAKFYLFSSTHVAGHFTGVITNDYASEFDPFSPQFGEKFAVPNLPVAFKDYTGHEMGRVYSDTWGFYDGLNYSTWTVNPPNPTGYAPTMMIACMNDPGPIPDPAHPGQMITDPLYNPAYANYCYEIPFMPGQTSYLDTPVVPTMAFADNYNLPDCSYPDATPAIQSVVSSDFQGPWVRQGGSGHTLTISALGNQSVPNHAYSGPSSTASPYNSKTITRHYGFGGSAGTVALVGSDGVSHPLTGVNWSDTTITGTVPNNLPLCAIQQRGVAGTERCGELVITTAAGKRSIDAITVTVGSPTSKTPTLVTPASATSNIFGETLTNPIQTAIDNATPGDLIIVGPGTYRELVIMWKPVRLQGVGAPSVIINADAHPAGNIDPWRRRMDCLFGLSLNGRPLINDGTFPADTYDSTGAYSCPASMQQRVDRIPFEAIVGWDTSGNGNLAQLLQEPTLMGAYEGAGITVLGRGIRIPGSSSDFWGASSAGGFPAGAVYLTNNNADCNASTTRTDGRDYGTSNFLCNPSRIDGLSVVNSSQGGGGIFLHAWNHNIEVSNNRITSNQGTVTGGITVGPAEFPDPVIVGTDVGAGVTPPLYNIAQVYNGVPPNQRPSATGEQAAYGYVRNVNVHNNDVSGNASIGDALYSYTPSSAGGVAFTSGSDFYKFNYNWVCGNLSPGDGAGVSHIGFSDFGSIANNWILFNQSTNPTLPTHGGGLGVLGASPDRTLPNGLECGNTASDADCPPGLPEGTGRGLMIDSNLIMGNSAESGSGGGLRLQMVNGQDVQNFPAQSSRWYGVTVQNNIIADNVAGWDGGGVSLQDALKVTFINNTVVHNDTTASSGVLFNTLAAPLSSTPPPGCTPQPDPTLPQDPSCIDPVPTSTRQAAGLVTMQNTPNLTAALNGVTVTCPNGFGYSGNGVNSCRNVSRPSLTNDLFWQNRSFNVSVGGFGSGAQNQQHLVSLVPLLNQTFTGMCATTGVDQNGGAAAPEYWDLGVRGDTGPTNHGSGVTLTAANSIFSTGSRSAADPRVLQRLASAAGERRSRLQRATGPVRVRRPATGLRPQQHHAGGDHRRRQQLDQPRLRSTVAGQPVDGLTVLGNYSIQNTSPAFNAGTNYGAPNHDFFGNPGRHWAGPTSAQSNCRASQPVHQYGQFRTATGSLTIRINEEVSIMNRITLTIASLLLASGTCAMATVAYGADRGDKEELVVPRSEP